MESSVSLDIPFSLDRESATVCVHLTGKYRFQHPVEPNLMSFEGSVKVLIILFDAMGFFCTT